MLAADPGRLLRVQRERVRTARELGVGDVEPESTIVTGTPGPGGVRPSMPICARHHSSPWSGSGVSVTAGTSYVRSLLREDERPARAEALHEPFRDLGLQAPEPQP